MNTMNAMNIKKVTIGLDVMDVIDEKEFNKRSKLDEPLFEDTCVERNGRVYPIQKRYDPTTPGVYDAGPFLKYTEPTENVGIFSSDNIVDFSRAKDLRGIIEIQDDLRRGEEARLTTINNVWEPTIYEDDTVELAALKEAITLKQIDPESYRPRYGSGSDSNNDNRLLNDKKNKTISCYKIKRFCDIYDIKATIIFEDKKGAINPMGKKIIAELTTEE